MVSFLKQGAGPGGSTASLALTEGAERLKERLGVIMNYKRRTKITKLLTGMLTFCMISGSDFVGSYPVAASLVPESSEDVSTSDRKSNSAQQAKQPQSEEKASFSDKSIYSIHQAKWLQPEEDAPRLGIDDVSSGTYIYDEELGKGYWKDLILYDLDGKNTDSDDSDGNHIGSSEKYLADGMEKKNGSYYYKGKRVKVIKDQYPDSAIYSFDPELKGKVSIKVVRNAKGRIKRITYMSAKEASRLIKRAGLKR